MKPSRMKPSPMKPSRMKPSRLTVAGALVVLLGALAACGGDSSDDEATDATPAGAQPTQPAITGLPGASGTVAAISGRTLQVQNDRSGQVAVSWTARTEFSTEVAATLDDLAVGDCVVVGADSSAATDSVAATSVRISPAVDGSCRAGFGPGGGPGGQDGDRPEGMPTDLPSGMPTDLPSDMPSGMPSDLPGGMVPGTVGEVTDVDEGGFTVEAAQPMAGSTSARTTVTVTVDDDTAYTRTVAGSSDDLAVGLCVIASGDSDSTGALTATLISVSEPVDGGCDAVLPGGQGRPPAGGTRS